MMADRKFPGLGAGVRLLVAVGATVCLLSCGGGGGGGAPAGPPSTSTTPSVVGDGIVISGLVSKGIFSGGRVQCFFSKLAEIPPDMIPRINLGDTATTVDIDAKGAYSCNAPPDTKMVAVSLVPSTITLSGALPLMKDEETGQSVVVPSAFLMRAVADIGGTTQKKIELNVTPLSEAGVVVATKSGGLTAKIVNLANSGLSNMFGLDILGTKPVQSNDTTAIAAATTAEIRMSKINASISRMATIDATGCGTKNEFGVMIDCTKNNWTQQFSLDTSGTTPKLSVTNFGYQTTLESLTSPLIDGIGNAANSAYKFAVEIGQVTAASIFSVFASVENILNDVIISDNYKERLNKLHAIIAGQYYHLAVMSEIVYSDKWVNGQMSGLGLVPQTPDPSHIYGRTYGFEGNYSVLDWGLVPGLNADEATRVNLQWNAFISGDGQEIIFAYRGSEGFTNWKDWLNNFNSIVCSSYLYKNQYQIALKQFQAVLSLPKYRYVNGINGIKKKIILTGHSLGGGLANFIGLINELDVDLVVTFNSAPICGALATDLVDASKLHLSKFRDIRIENEVLYDVAWLLNRATAIPNEIVNGKLAPEALAFPGAGPNFYPSPLVNSLPNSISDHLTGILLFAVKAGYDKCVSDVECAKLVPAVKPVTTTVQQPLFLINTFGAASLSATGAYRPALSVIGSNLSSINKIEWACKLPGGAVCSGSPYVWTSGNWAGKTVFESDANVTLYPQLLVAGDGPGVYNWTATFSSLDGNTVSKAFTVNNTQSTGGGIIVSQISSPQFTSGTTNMATSSKLAAPSIVVTGLNLGAVVGIEWRWSGAVAGGASWAKTDANWASKVSLGADGKLTLTPTVVDANPTWSGTAIWTGTLRDAAGASRNITFSVTYQPPVVQVPVCVAPAVLQGGQCVAQVTSCTAPLVLVNGACVTQQSLLKPDLVPQAVAIPGSSVAFGGAVTINYIVANIGNGASPVSTTRVQIVGPTGAVFTQPEASTQGIAAGAQVSESRTISMASAPAGTYTVYVIVDFPRTANQSNLTNDTSPGATFTVQAAVSVTTAPTPTSPINSVVVGNTAPTLTWSGGSNMGSLQVNVSKSPYGAANIVYTSAYLSSGTTAVVPTTLTSGTNYRWDVTACSSANGAGTCVTGGNALFSTPAPVVTTAPTPASPINSVVVGNTSPTLIWSGGTNIGSLQVNVSKSPYGAANIVYTSAYLSSGTTTVVPTTLTSGTNYRWDVTACSGANGAGTCVTGGNALFSTPAPVVTTAPTPASPINSVVVGNTAPTLSWSGGSNIGSLQVNVSKSPYGPANIVYTSAYLSAGTTSIVPSGLTAGTSYRWDVTACSGASGAGTCATGGNALFSTPAAAVSLVVNGIASSYSATTFPYQPTIFLTGSGFSSVVNTITLTCTKNGVSCGNYVRTAANWSAMYFITNDTSAMISPVLALASDAAGTYNWTVTFAGGGQSTLKSFTVVK